jgi:hypothetical protein
MPWTGRSPRPRQYPCVWNTAQPWATTSGGTCEVSIFNKIFYIQCSDASQKLNFSYNCVSFIFLSYIYIVFQTYLYMMIEGSGSGSGAGSGSGTIPLTIGSGSGSGMPKNVLIRIRIRIRNTGFYLVLFL